MVTPILTTKLYIPPPRTKTVLRPRLIQRLNAGLPGKLTLISAPAGFGKTTLLAEWIAGGERPVIWLSLDEGDNDTTRFLTYLIAALQTIAPHTGEGVLGVLQSPQPPPVEVMLTTLLNEITRIQTKFVLVLDDYHVIDTLPVDQALGFLIEYLPPQMHLVIATREDPNLPLARLRVRDQLTELRVTDLRFTLAEAAGFLNQVMGLNLSTEAITALETRTEGWIAGLQLAALSMQGQQDTTDFIKNFTGSHHFVLDYLAEEVLQQQPAAVQTFLLHTSILDRMCAALCDAVLDDPSVSGQEMLKYLENANLFIIPLDNQRRWYRYHHLFADLLRQRLHQPEGVSPEAAELHRRASQWYEDNGLEIEAFHHAAAAQDMESAERLIEGKGMPLLFRGGATPILNWLKSLPAPVLDTRPTLCVMYASALLFANQITGVEQKLQAAEAALEGIELNDKIRDLIGHIASIRATLAVTQYQVEAIIAQSHRALEYLHPDNLPVRTATTWTLGYAYQLQGDRAAASRAYNEAAAISQRIGHQIITIMATIGIGHIQEGENQLHLAAETYHHILQLLGDPPLPIACEAHLGLARIFYAWNDLDAAWQHGQQALQLAMQLPNTDRFIICELFLARLKLTQRDAAGAATILAKALHLAHQHHFVHRLPEIADLQVLTLLQQGNLAAAEHLIQTHDLPISQARIHLAQGDTSTALVIVETWHQQVAAKGWDDERLKAMLLHAIVLQAHGDSNEAISLPGDVLALAAPGGFIRLFIDEGLPMAQLLSRAAAAGLMPDYTAKLLAVFKAEEYKTYPPLIEPLSLRELEVLQLIAQGLSNQEISERLYLALSSIKGHNQNIFGKLQVQRRTEAVARARELGLL